MKRRMLAGLTLAAALLAADCGREDAAVARRSDARPLAVRVATAASGRMGSSYEAVGTVRSQTTSVLSSKVMGQVLTIHPRQGDYVKAGQTLVVIDDRDASAASAKAKAGLSEAESALQEVEQTIQAAASAKEAADAGAALAASTYRRFQALLERKSVSRQEFEEVEFKHKAAVAEASRTAEHLTSMQARKRQVLARIEQARADVAAAEIYAGYFHLSAPFSGLVAARHAEPGALAAPGAALLTIEDSHNYRLEVSVEESKLLHVRQGTTAAVRIDALGGDEIGGTVSEIVPAADPASRSFLVKLQLPATPRLRSGMFGRAAFQTGAAEVMTVPRSGLVERGQLVGVFVLDSSNRASFRLIKPGRTFGDRIEVLSGLNGGERVAAERTDGLQEGVLVTPLAAR